VAQDEEIKSLYLLLMLAVRVDSGYQPDQGRYYLSRSSDQTSYYLGRVDVLRVLARGLAGDRLEEGLRAGGEGGEHVVGGLRRGAGVPRVPRLYGGTRRRIGDVCVTTWPFWWYAVRLPSNVTQSSSVVTPEGSTTPR
jgi:hypothetical protein